MRSVSIGPGSIALPLILKRAAASARTLLEGLAGDADLGHDLDVERLAPAGVGHLVERRRLRPDRVADHGVEPAVLPYRIAHEACDVRLHGAVGAMGDHRPAGLARDLSSACLESGLAANSSAMARSSPPLAAVTTATLPRSPRSMLLSPSTPRRWTSIQA